jgi:hypothetical protein
MSLHQWFWRKALTLTQNADAGANYQFNITVYYGIGTDTDNTFYLNGRCRTDFADLRFTDENGFNQPYWIQSKTDGDNAVVWVKCTTDLAARKQVVFMYYGNASASSQSSAADVFIDVISGVVGAWPLDEVAGGNATDYSGNNNTGTATGTSVTDSTFYTGQKARQTDGDDDYISTGITGFSHAKGSLLLKFAANFDNTANGKRLVTSFNVGAQRLIDIYYSASKFRFYDDISGTEAQSANQTFSSGTNFQITATWDNTVQKQLYVNLVAVNTATTWVAGTFANNYIADYGAGVTGWAPATFSGVFWFANIVLTPTQISNMYNNYIDAKLVTGSVLVRKWAYPAPTASSSNQEQPVWAKIAPIMKRSIYNEDEPEENR